MTAPSLPQPPDAEVGRLLPADAYPLRHPRAAPVWLGMVWSRLGRADLAWAWWEQVADVPELAAWVGAERGRVLRELGLHAAAEDLEQSALDAATDVVDVAMLRVSLAADAVGRGDPQLVDLRLTAARPLAASLADGPRAARQRLRLVWVEIEAAWLRGEPPSTAGLPAADPDGTVTEPVGLHHGTDFHRAKALLFGGLVHREPRLLDRAAALAPAQLAWAVHLARADLGLPGAHAAAVASWREVVPPPGYEREVAATPTARRLTTVGGASPDQARPGSEDRSEGRAAGRSEGSSRRSPSSS